MKLKIVLFLIYMTSYNLKAQNLYPYLDNGLYGYMNIQGDIIIQPQYAFAKDFSDCGLALVLEPNKKFGYINLKGKYIFKPEFILASNFKNNQAFIFEKGSYKIINSQGVILKQLPNNIHTIKLNKKTFYKDFIITTKSGKNGLISPDGELLIDTVYTNLTYLNKTLFAEKHYHNDDSISYQVIDYTNNDTNYSFFGFQENWETGLTEVSLLNEITLETKIINYPHKKKEYYPIYHEINDEKNKYFSSSSNLLLNETQVSHKKNLNLRFIK